MVTGQWQFVGPARAKRQHQGVQPVAGKFEVHQDEEKFYKFRLKDGDGNVVAVSPRFKSLSGVVDGINAMRENAATGVVVDLRERQRQS
jgi:uncharacterized protein YegP (UPF0339 family)